MAAALLLVLTMLVWTFTPLIIWQRKDIAGASPAVSLKLIGHRMESICRLVFSVVTKEKMA